MQNVQLFVKDPEIISSGNFGIGLDMFVSEPIKITKSIQSIEEPQATTSAFSRTFRVPNTPPNAKFFKAAFNVNSVTFNATKKIPAYINVNGVYFVSGNIRLNSIIYNPDVEKIQYELIFMGETSNFSSIVAPKNLSDLNLIELGHSLNYSNIQLSWNGNLLNGNVLYPLAEYGYTYDPATKQPNIPTLAVYNATTGVKGFTNSINPLNLNQFKPFVKAKYIWDRIFKEAGFTYTSSFLNNSQIFNSLYMISSNTSTSNAEMAVTPNLVTQMPAYGNYMFTGSTDIKLQIPTEVTDTANNWNTNTSTYSAITPGATGGYTYNFYLTGMSLGFSAPAKPTGPPDSYLRTFQLKAKVTYANGTTALFSKTAYLDVGTGSAVFNQVKPVLSENPYTSPSPTNSVFEWNLTLFQGSTVEFFCNLGTEVSSGAYFISGELLADGPPIVDPAGLMPSQYKQIDFIKGINDRFKLMWEPDPDNPNNFVIEPWVDWVKGGTQRDWTDKLDRNFDVTLTPLFQTQPREIIFKDSEESDLYNFSYQQANKQTFGQLEQDSGIEIITGNREIKSIFAPVPLGPIGNSDRFIIPHFAKDTETERQPIQIKPRLVFYNGLVTAPNTWYMKNDAGAAVSQTTYPLVSQFSGYPFNSAVMDLNWTNVNQFWTANTLNTGTGRTPITAFTTYWQSWFNFTYSPYGRIMEATFALDTQDLYSLKFNDKIFIKDSWWMPIEVKDFVLGQPKQSVKVKLVKMGDDVGVRVNDFSGLGLYAFEGIVYGANGCAACCNDNIYVQYTVYGANPVFDQNNILYANSEGTVALAPGSYSNGTYSLNVDSRGIVQSITLCSLCSCDGSGLTAFTVCSGTSVCSVCCCASYSQTIYGNGATLATSTALYGNAAGTTALIPNRWYGNASAVAQVGSNGTTIIGFGNCTGCACGEVPPGE